ncbi:uncharacterized protein LTHEOB_10305 [Neofusicoccum parvum]|nr:uncharacterized protein LTHEOB_10305 [Neofusicoccum parvum]
MPHRHTLALITIGQSPRHDYTPDLPSLLPPSTALVQHGALDALTPADVAARLAPGPDTTQVLVSRMRSGAAVVMDAARLAPLVEACVRRVAGSSSVDAVVLLCTGDVPAAGAGAGARVPVVAPQPAVRAFLEEEGRRGCAVVVVSPEARQVGAARARWEGVGGCRVVAAGAATPYGEDSEKEVRGVGEWVRRAVEGEAGRVVVYLDCMGYTLEHKRIVEEVTGGGVEVVVPREVVFKAVGKLFGEA